METNLVLSKVIKFVHNSFYMTLSIKIISATPGFSTTDKILDIISDYPQGITTKELSDQLNRPVSMVNFYLKQLVNTKLVYARLDQPKQHWIYYGISHSLN